MHVLHAKWRCNIAHNVLSFITDGDAGSFVADSDVDNGSRNNDEDSEEEYDDHQSWEDDVDSNYFTFSITMRI